MEKIGHFNSKKFKVVSEDKARKIIKKDENVVVVHTKMGCPACDNFLPNVLEPAIFKGKFEDSVTFIEVQDQLTFPVKEHPTTYFYKDGKNITWAVGSAPALTVDNMLTRFYGRK